MSTDDKRIKVSFVNEPELLKIIKREAILDERSESWLVLRAVKHYYRTRKEEAKVFTPTQLGEDQPDKTPVFGTRPALSVESESKAPHRPDR